MNWVANSPRPRCDLAVGSARLAGGWLGQCFGARQVHAARELRPQLRRRGVALCRAVQTIERADLPPVRLFGERARAPREVSIERFECRLGCAPAQLESAHRDERGTGFGVALLTAVADAISKDRGAYGF